MTPATHSKKLWQRLISNTVLDGSTISSLTGNKRFERSSNREVINIEYNRSIHQSLCNWSLQARTTLCQTQSVQTQCFSAQLSKGLSPCTVHNIVKRFRESGGGGGVRKGHGRKPLLNARGHQVLWRLFPGTPCLFQQDNARRHSAWVTTAWLHRHRVIEICSPDLSSYYCIFRQCPNFNGNGVCNYIR